MPHRDLLLTTLAAQCLACAAALVALLATVRHPAALRSALWRTALAAFALSPLVSVALARVGAPAVAVPLKVPLPAARSSVVLAMPQAAPSPGDSAPASGTPAVAMRSKPAPRLGACGIGPAVWAAGTSILLALLACSTTRSWLLLRRSSIAGEPLRGVVHQLAQAMGLRSPPAVRLSGTVGAPLVAGVVRPCLVLPDSFDAGSPGARSVLAHELAHVARRDTLEQAAARLVRAIWWWHPASWALAAWLRRTAEEACDDWAVSLTGERTAYANALVSCAESLTYGAVGIPAARRGGALRRRIRAIVGKGETGMLRLRRGARFALAAACAGVLLGCGAARVRTVTPGHRAPTVPSGYAPVREADYEVALRVAKEPQAAQALRQLAARMRAEGRFEGEILAALEPSLGDGDRRVRIAAAECMAEVAGGTVPGSARAALIAMAGEALESAAEMDLLRLAGKVLDPGDLAAMARDASLPVVARLRLVEALERTGPTANVDEGMAILAEMDLPPDAQGRIQYLHAAAARQRALSPDVAQVLVRVLRLPDEEAVVALPAGVRHDGMVAFTQGAVTATDLRSVAATVLSIGGPGVGAVSGELRRQISEAPDGKRNDLLLGALWRSGTCAEALACARALLASDDEGVRCTALGGLGGLQEPVRADDGKFAVAPEVSALVCESLADPSGKVRGAAASALGRLGLPNGTRSPVERLVLTDPDPAAWQWAVRGLMAVGTIDGLRQRLLAQYKGATGPERVLAAEKLVHTTCAYDANECPAGTYAIPEELLADLDAEVRKAVARRAAEAYRARPEAERLAAIRRLREDHDPEVRAALEGSLRPTARAR